MLFLIFLFPLISGQKDPHFLHNRNTIVHLFEWKWGDIASECELFFKHKGYGAIQVSPPNENRVVDKRPWYERYQPVSYKIITRSGTEDQFLEMSKRCNDAGVRIYADIVVNHMTGFDGTVKGTGGSTGNGTTKSYPAIPYTANDFHESCGISNYKDADQVRKCELSGLRDLDQSKPNVRNKIVEYLNHLVDLGVAGFRIDAAKHMYPEDLAKIYKAVKDLNTTFGFSKGSRPFIYQEVIDLGGEAVKKEQYTPNGAVLEFQYGNSLSYVFRGKYKLKVLQNYEKRYKLISNPKDAVVFIDNHDNERGHGAGGSNIITYKDLNLFKKANAFMLAHPYGITRVLSDYSFSDANEGPPHESNYNILSPNPSGFSCSNGWNCEHRWPEIFRMVHFRNVVNKTPLTNFWYNKQNEDQIAFCRGKRGFIAITNKGDISANLNTCLPQGTYCDVYGGDKEGKKCTGKSVKVNSNGVGRVELKESDGVLAIHVGSKLD